MHPVCIDGCFQTVGPSLWAGERSAINAVLIPAVIDDLIINPTVTRTATGLSVTDSQFTGRGRQEEAKNYLSNCSVFDSETGSLLLKLSGLRYHKLDTGEGPHAAHTYNSSVWKPDVTFLTTSQLPYIEVEGKTSKLNHVIDLVAHKKPGLKIMEINLNPIDRSSIWLQAGDKSARSAYQQYVFVSADPNTLISVQAKYEARRKCAFSLLDVADSQFTSSESDFDLLIIKRPTFTGEAMLSLAQTARTMVLNGGYLLFVEQGLSPSDSDSDESDIVIVNGQSTLDRDAVRTALVSNGFHDTLNICCATVKSAYLSRADQSDDTTSSITKSVNIVRLAKGTRINLDVETALGQAGWKVVQHESSSYPKLQTKSTVVILDELSSSLLSTITDDQWQAIKNLIDQGCKILWVTEGSQYKITKPDNALIHGLFRTIRAEDPSLSLTTLDVESGRSPAAIVAIDRILRFLQIPAPKVDLESEFVERAGILHVNRVLPDVLVNETKTQETKGTAPVVKSLHDLDTVATLRAERLGSLDALQYSETTPAEVPMKDHNVEVEIYAAGLNFKDVAVTMGIVPGKEHLLGLEGAGIVRRIGKGATDYKVGDRVVVAAHGTFANRIQVPTEKIHLIPNSLSLEEAATIPLVYLTSLYSLSNIANLQKDQSVLIHSAAGGIGLSCI